jgi:hypothetical protein
MEMAGKHSDHYFCRWQAIIVTTIIYFCEKNEEEKKVLRIACISMLLYSAAQAKLLGYYNWSQKNTITLKK